MTNTPVRGTLPFRVIEHLKSLPAGATISSSLALAQALDQPHMNVPQTLKLAREAGAVKAVTSKGERRLLLWSLGDGTPTPAVWKLKADEPDEIDDEQVVHRIVPAPKPPAGHLGGNWRLPFTHAPRPQMARTASRPEEDPAAVAVATSDAADPPPADGACPHGVPCRYCVECDSPPAAAPVVDDFPTQGGAPIPTSLPPAAPAPPVRTGMRLAVWSDGALSVHRGADRIEFTADEAGEILTFLFGTVAPPSQKTQPRSVEACIPEASCP